MFVNVNLNISYSELEELQQRIGCAVIESHSSSFPTFYGDDGAAGINDLDLGSSPI